MHSMYVTARRKAGLSQEVAADELHIAQRTLINYEMGRNVPPPETVCAMSRLYNDPTLTQHYCCSECKIGSEFAYEPIKPEFTESLQNIIIALRQEHQEALEAIGQMEVIARNKNHRADFTEQQWCAFMGAVDQIMDSEHCDETLKFRLACWEDMARAVEAHNAKCRERGYVRRGAA